MNWRKKRKRGGKGQLPFPLFEALRALVLVGHAASLPEVDHFAAGLPGISERIRQQAVLTAQAIRQRTTQSMTLH